jgi:hypothetical protein
MGDGGELAAEKHVRYIVTVEKVGRLSLCSMQRLILIGWSSLLL